MNAVSNESSQEYSFSLRKIQIIEKQLVFRSQKEEKLEFDFDISLNIKTDSEKKQSFHFMNVVISDKDDKKKIGALSIVCIFDIDNLESLIINEPDETGLPRNLVYLLNTVVIGTIRGVMYSEFRGTILDDALLPVLDPRAFQKREK
ncbi:hypothetical protein [Chitinophaga sp. LS1]|uniref:hypothetical protein n=1 Tax=Chitinophaga sp. LS1 TaxID=3051176 RepID=UPI002AAADF10|nr:hypothetical protein [Chitinophaga sp. LS1]WPV65972.1 hypothetical protein QQL36_29665 [Chitinophaga sp. LS1]